MIKLSTAQLWVHDQGEALDFYTKKLGMEVRSDVTLAEMGNFRWLTVGPASQPDIAITLMAIPGPPVMDAETAGGTAQDPPVSGPLGIRAPTLQSVFTESAGLGSRFEPASRSIRVEMRRS